jgi:hypothetical protein
VPQAATSSPYLALAAPNIWSRRVVRCRRRYVGGHRPRHSRRSAEERQRSIDHRPFYAEPRNAALRANFNADVWLQRLGRIPAESSRSSKRRAGLVSARNHERCEPMRTEFCESLYGMAVTYEVIERLGSTTGMRAAPVMPSLRDEVTGGYDLHLDTVYAGPTLWFRNTWSWEASGSQAAPRITARGSRLVADHPRLGALTLTGDGEPTALCCDNETNTQRLYGVPGRSRYPKDGINDHIVHGADTVNPEGVGSKAALHYLLTVPAGERRQIRVRLAESGHAPDLGAELSEILRTVGVRRTSSSATSPRLAPLPTRRWCFGRRSPE